MTTSPRISRLLEQRPLQGAHGRLIITLLTFLLVATSAFAQRPTDPLDRGLVAVQLKSGVFLSWRILAEEYFDVTYHVYRDGVRLNTTPLQVSNYTDTNGTANASYTVRAVINGKLQAACKDVKPWNTGRIDVSRQVLFPCPAYLPIPMANIKDRQGNTIWQRALDGSVTASINYEINDVSLGDITGDGRIDFLVKRLNQTDRENGYPENNNTAFDLIEAYDMDGQRLWYIDCGPNMVSLNATELNAAVYDWDEDGRSEVILRGADNMIIHMSDGTTLTVGGASVNTRSQLASHTDPQYEWTHTGSEYLLYLDGLTGKPYWIKDYPLPRFESGETNEKKAWGDDYGHRSSKHFIGAPFLDGRHASIFLARGIYTRHKMIAYDVNPITHELTERWRWSNNTSSSPWYGQGNHNFSIADVDGDGCDEIIYGSMTIDNNGRGLSTSGLGHGDALHVGDLDPYRPGLEVFACNEAQPSNNYRNATTSEIYYRDQGSADDGRAIAGNFLEDIPGSIGMSTASGVIALSADQVIDGIVNDWNPSSRTPNPAALNFRIYWDGDLLDESLNSPGTAKEAIILKANRGRIMQTSGVNLINDSKNNPCAQGDILGDWREELVLRNWANSELRIYTTTTPTSHRLPALWFDHAYRQAIVWQPQAYNQPPHTSFFLGELEDITQAPPPLTTTARTQLPAGSVITTAHNGQHLLITEAGNIGIDANGASPAVLTINVPSTVSGNNNSSNITTSYSSCQLGATVGNTNAKGDLTGPMRLVKQGDGLLKLTARNFSFTGPTDIWAGAVFFRGTMNASPVWMNRHTSLYTAAHYRRTLTMEYGASLHPTYTTPSATSPDYASVRIDTLFLHEGARIVFQINPNTNQQDTVIIQQLNIRTHNWTYGPPNLAPVFEVNTTAPLADGMYRLGTLSSIGQGKLDDIIVQCNQLLNKQSPTQIVLEGSRLYLVVGNYIAPDQRDPSFYHTVWQLNFEQPSTTNYGYRILAGAVEAIEQTQNTDNTHYLHIYQGNQNDRTITLTLADNQLFKHPNAYRLSFDLALVGGNQNASTTTVNGSNGTLFTINYSAWASKANVANSAGEVIGQIDITPYVKGETYFSTYQPTIFNHFVITAEPQRGISLSVSHKGETIIPETIISDHFTTIDAITHQLGRYYSHIAIDDITLAYKCAGPGDVNFDNNINIADVTALVKLILHKPSNPVATQAADVNADDNINISDVTALVNLILHKNK